MENIEKLISLPACHGQEMGITASAVGLASLVIGTSMHGMHACCGGQSHDVCSAEAGMDTKAPCFVRFEVTPALNPGKVRSVRSFVGSARWVPGNDDDSKAPFVPKRTGLWFRSDLLAAWDP